MTRAEAIADATELAERRAQVESDIIGLLLRHPRRGCQWADDAGVTGADFDQPDLRAIFVAVSDTRERPTIDILKACRFVLRAVGKWDDRTPAGTLWSMWWSDERLARTAIGDLETIDRCPGWMLPILLTELRILTTITRNDLEVLV